MTFTNKHKSEGEYLGLITSVIRRSNEWVLGITLRQDTDAIYPLRLQIHEDSLWKIRDLLAATKCPNPYTVGSQDGELVPLVQLSALKNREIGVCLENGEYETEDRSVISSFFPPEEL